VFDSRASVVIVVWLCFLVAVCVAVACAFVAFNRVSLFPHFFPGFSPFVTHTLHSLNSTQRTGERVIAIDVDPVRLTIAKHNAEIYGVADRIDFILGDFMQLAPTLKADVVFLSPPWGGPEYADAKEFDLRTMIPMDGVEVFEKAKLITDNIAYYLPRNTPLKQIAQLSEFCEVETVFSHNRLYLLNAYFGYLVQEHYFEEGQPGFKFANANEEEEVEEEEW